jgi:hypothetical protein
MLAIGIEENHPTQSLVDRPQCIAQYADGRQPPELSGTFSGTPEDSRYAAGAIIHADAPLRHIGHIQLIRRANCHAADLRERQPSIERISGISDETGSRYLVDLADHQHRPGDEPKGTHSTPPKSVESELIDALMAADTIATSTT